MIDATHHRSDQHAMLPAVTVLLLDGDRITLESLPNLLQAEGYEVTARPEGSTDIELGAFRLVLAETSLLVRDDLCLLRQIRQANPRSGVICLTNYGAIELALEAIKHGAYDYLTKPLIEDDVRLTVQRALWQQGLVDENRRLRDAAESHYSSSVTPTAGIAPAAGWLSEACETGNGDLCSLSSALADPERRIILNALQSNHGSRKSTAEQLGINRTTLYKKMKKYGLLQGVYA